MTNALHLPLVRDALRDPVDQSKLVTLSRDSALFASGRTYPCLDEHPILIDESTSLFSIADVIKQSPTTQDSAYHDTSKLKNYVRRRVLPGLTWDRSQASRYQRLAQQVAGRLNDWPGTR